MWESLSQQVCSEISCQNKALWTQAATIVNFVGIIVPAKIGLKIHILKTHNLFYCLWHSSVSCVICHSYTENVWMTICFFTSNLYCISFMIYLYIECSEKSKPLKERKLSLLIMIILVVVLKIMHIFVSVATHITSIVETIMLIADVLVKYFIVFHYFHTVLTLNNCCFNIFQLFSIHPLHHQVEVCLLFWKWWDPQHFLHA